MNFRILQFLFKSLRVLYAYVLVSRNRIHKRWINRRYWVRPINVSRPNQGDFAGLFQELKTDPVMFCRYTRMTLRTFNKLLSMVEPFLRKSNWRALLPEQRLIITLRYLATGDQFLSIALAYRVGESTVSAVVKETCQVLCNVLKDKYLLPPTPNQWKITANGFLERWNIPNCVGSFDGKHVTIQAPPNSGSLYFNYKKNFSIVLLAACDHNYKFTLVDIGSYESMSDGSIFNSSEIGRAVREDSLGVPRGQQQLPGSDKTTQYCFIGDQAFPLAVNFLRPYAGRRLPEKKQIFNYRLSRARRTIENAFGILSSRWRIYRRPICVHPAIVDKIILCTVCLHNFLKCEDEANGDASYVPPQFIDNELANGVVIEGEWRQDIGAQQGLPPTTAHRARTTATNQRDVLCDYFITPAGEVPWQYDYVRRGMNRA